MAEMDIDFACAHCGKDMSNEDRCWKPGDVLLFDQILCCSFACALKFASGPGIAEDHRPGRPCFRPKRLCSDGDTWEKWNPSAGAWEVE